MLIVPLLLLAAVATEPLDITGAWVREAPPGVEVMAAYATLCNATDDALVLEGAASAAFARIEMHETVETAERAFMRRLETLHLAAGECATFEPGGRHFMLFDPATPLRAGDSISFTFTFADGSTQQATLAVRRADDMLHHHGHH